MKTTIMPAQITSIEDTITAKLSLTQIILLILPIFMAAIIFAVMPPELHIRLYKTLVAILLALPFVILALRVNGQLILNWVIILATYQHRPRRYLLSETLDCECESTIQTTEQEGLENVKKPHPLIKHAELEPHEIFALDNFLSGKKITFLANSRGQLDATIENK